MHMRSGPQIEYSHTRPPSRSLSSCPSSKWGIGTAAGGGARLRSGNNSHTLGQCERCPPLYAFVQGMPTPNTPHTLGLHKRRHRLSRPGTKQKLTQHELDNFSLTTGGQLLFGNFCLTTIGQLLFGKRWTTFI